MKLKTLLIAISEIQKTLTLLEAQGLHNRNLGKALEISGAILDPLVTTSSKTETKNKSPKRKS
jgi:hypothetical protein